MPLNYAQLQKDFMSALQGSAESIDFISSHKFDANEHFRIYRNNFLLNHFEALEAHYPLVLKLVGENCFRAIAQKYLEAYPPHTGCYVEWGGEMPSFIGSLDELKSLPYLSDVAQYEWLVNEACHEAYVPAVKIEEFQILSNQATDADRLILKPQPSLRFLASQYALKEMITYLKEDRCDELSYEAKDPQYFIFYQQKDYFTVTEVSIEIYTVLGQMARGLEIGEIIEKHSLSHTASDFSNIFMFLFENGLVSEVMENKS